MTDNTDPDIEDLVSSLKLSPEQKKAVGSLIVKKIDDLLAEKVGEEINIDSLRKAKKELINLKASFTKYTKE